MTETELKQDSTRNIARRYSYLFRLPSIGLAVVYASLPLIGVEIIARSAAHESVLFVVFYALVTELVFIAAIQMDLLMLRGRSGLATFRRLATVAIISNGMWLVISVIGLLVYLMTGSESKLLSLVLLGAFFAIAFRAIIFGSVFYTSPIFGLPPAIVQPTILFIPVALAMNLQYVATANAATALIGGLISIVAVEVYLDLIDKPVKGLKALRLLQAFLTAWTVGNPTELEHYFQITSEEAKVNTEMVRIKSTTASAGDPSALLVVPGIHPGPFSPVGSSNLPGDIYSKLRSEATVPLIFHSISDHELNLPSKEEVRKYANSLENRSTVERGKTMAGPLVIKKGRGTASGFVLGRTLIIALTLAPNGMEDLSGIIREKIEQEASKLGYDECLVIDSHNSLGDKPDEQETQDLIGASMEVINGLVHQEQSAFNFGFAHSSEISVSDLPADIGPAGLGLLLFDTGKSRFCLAVVDANNSTLGFRGKVIENFSRTSGENLLEICTSDTHVTAAKVNNAKGYYALGDLIASERFCGILESLLEKAKSRLSSGNYETFLSVSSVRTIGSKILDNFSGLLDQSALVAKRGAQALAVLAAVITLVVAIL